LIAVDTIACAEGRGEIPLEGLDEREELAVPFRAARAL